ncbi:thioester domain-containing protein [Nocardiopsis sediminis]|uniref:Thioester domain-containing protein n=1 Tax=Nocardiopsis sediminis TaxID=1778267 RepID=A0ABV8FGA7_9ACTN
MPGFARRWTAVLCAAAAIGTGVAPATAADGISRVDPTPVAGSTVRLTDGAAAETSLYRILIDDGVSVTAYCADISISVDPQVTYVEGPLAGAEGIPDGAAAPLNWIVRNSYPLVDLDRLGTASGVPGLDQERAIAATQAAVWHYTNGTELAARPGERGGGNHPAVGALYRYLVDSAGRSELPDPRPTLELSPGRLEGGDPALPLGPLTVRTTDTGPVELSVKGGSALRLADADGATITQAADGEEFFLHVDPAAPAGVATVYAQADDATVEPGRLFTGRDGVQTQPLLTAEPAVSPSTATVKVDWSASPAPAEEPAPPPSEEPPATASPPSPSAPEPSPTRPPVVIADDRRPDRDLAFTGTWAGALVAIGAGLLVAGAAMVYATRRRKR